MRTRKFLIAAAIVATVLGGAVALAASLVNLTPASLEGLCPRVEGYPSVDRHGCQIMNYRHQAAGRP
jgi:hypothetical protein